MDYVQDEEDYVEDEENLGRGCFQNHRGRGRANKRYFEKSFEREGYELSVDRLDPADFVRLRTLHEEEARSRGEDRSFYGWHCFKASIVRRAGSDVRGKRTVKNPWHAEVVASEEARDDLTELCEVIATSANWLSKEAQGPPPTL